VFEYDKGDAGKFAHQAASALARLFCVAALALGVSIIGAEAKKKPHPIEEPILDSVSGEPLTLVISLRDQKMDVYQGIILVTSTKVSTGTRSYPTKAGVFSILEKQRYHHSNMYSAAPMPWMQRLTWSGTALHGGVVLGYPASHGCIRLPFSFAPKLFDVTARGENVVVAHDRPKPELIDHPVLFQPNLPTLVDAAEKTDGKIALNETASDTSNAAGEKVPTNTSGEWVIVDESSSAPLRILVTRQTERDRIIDVQYQLASMGYIKPQKFTGRLGGETVAAIKAFQKANGMNENGKFDGTLAKQVYEIVGKEEPPEGHLFVRQQFRPVFDVAITFQNPEQPRRKPKLSAAKSRRAETRWAAPRHSHAETHGTEDFTDLIASRRQIVRGCFTAGAGAGVVEWPAEWRIRR
jgi:L,D-transpeptidase catalytic domain/Putative peptidoglycan binding domain